MSWCESFLQSGRHAHAEVLPAGDAKPVVHGLVRARGRHDWVEEKLKIQLRRSRFNASRQTYARRQRRRCGQWVAIGTGKDSARSERS